MPKSVLLLSTSLNLGGAEMQVYLLAKALYASGWRVCVVSLIQPKHFFEELRANGIDVFSLEMKPGKVSLRAINRLSAIYKTWRPDIVHSHMYHANILGRVMRFWYPIVPLISTAHSFDETHGGFFRYWLYRLTRPLTSYMTNVSVTSWMQYVKIGLIDAKSGGCVPNGIDTAKFLFSNVDRVAIRGSLGILPDTFVWGAIGRFVDAKDYENLIHAVSHLNTLTTRPFHIFVVGDGPLFSDIKAALSRLNLDGRVTLLGPREDIKLFLSGIDGFVMSSKLEGLPMVLLEAMAMERICVSTDVGGIRELLGPISNSLLVKPSMPRDLGSAMLDAMTLSLARRVELGAQSRYFVNLHYGLVKISIIWQELYNRFLRPVEEERV